MDIFQAKSALSDAGRAFGRDYEGLHEDSTKISAAIEVAANAKIKELSQAGSSLGCLLFFLNAILFIAGLGLFIIALVQTSFWVAWFWVVGFWVLGLVIALSRNKENEKLFSSEELFDAFFDSAASVIEERRSEKREDEIVPAEKPRGPKPSPQPFGVSHEGAEALCAEWMKYLGEMDAEFTRVVGDGGIDVYSSRYIGQVKNYSGSVGVAAIRELAGVAVVDGRTPLFFTSGSYAAGAIEFANQSGVALFIYDAVAGTISHANISARKYLKEGL